MALAEVAVADFADRVGIDHAVGVSDGAGAATAVRLSDYIVPTSGLFSFADWKRP